MVNRKASEEILLGSSDKFRLTNEEIGLRELLSIIWGRRWQIFVVTCLFSLASVLYALNQPNIYKAKALLAPSTSSGNGGLSAMARQFGGLASLAGINLGGGSGGDKTMLAIEVMQSRQFVSRFIQKYDLLVPLMAAKGWDPVNDELILDSEVYDSEKKRWIRDVAQPSKQQPSMWEAYKVFKDLLSVSQSKDSGLVSVAIESVSPSIAQQWVSLLIEEINEDMKSKDLQEARSSILYLRSQLDNTEVTQMQNVFYQLIEEQTKTLMLSEVRTEYVFVTVDPAVIPEEKYKPKRALISLFGTMLGLVLSVVWVFFREVFSAPE